MECRATGNVLRGDAGTHTVSVDAATDTGGTASPPWVPCVDRSDEQMGRVVE
jgi:hypothetical protein